VIAAKVVQTPIADWSVATAGTAAMTIAQSPDPSSLWTVGGMSSVVGILLWLSYKREERQAAEQARRDEAAMARETAMMKRMSELETSQATKLERASDRLLEVVVQQGQTAKEQAIAAQKQIEGTQQVEKCLEGLAVGQNAVKDLLEIIVHERPCLLAGHADLAAKLKSKEAE
jgi:predicted ATPase